MHTFPAMDGQIDIKARRRELGLSQCELAERLGVDRSTVSRLENGVHVLRRPMLLLLRQILGDEVRASGDHAPDHATSVAVSPCCNRETVNSEGGA